MELIGCVVVQFMLAQFRMWRGVFGRSRARSGPLKRSSARLERVALDCENMLVRSWMGEAEHT
jgi:hypothetical protein